jgi:multidrug efflux system outer membrane protein
MISFSRLLPILIAGLPLGCAVGPDYHPPKTVAPAGWISPRPVGETNLGNTQPATRNTTRWPSPPSGGETNPGAHGVTRPTPDASGAAWWQSFHDPELNSLILRAGQSNLNLRAAVARVREARAAVRVISADYGPTIDATGSYARDRFSANGFPPFPPGVPLDANVYQAGFDAAWELDVFGGTRRAVEAARADAAVAEFGRRDLLITIEAEVARNYVEARAFQRRLEVVNSNIKAESEILALTRDRFTN